MQDTSLHSPQGCWLCVCWPAGLATAAVVCGDGACSARTRCVHGMAAVHCRWSIAVRTAGTVAGCCCHSKQRLSSSCMLHASTQHLDMYVQDGSDKRCCLERRAESRPPLACWSIAATTFSACFSLSGGSLCVWMNNAYQPFQPVASQRFSCCCCRLECNDNRN